MYTYCHTRSLPDACPIGRRRQAQGGAGESRGAAVQAVPRGRRPLPLQAGRCRWRAAAAGRGPRIRARHRATGRAAQAGGRCGVARQFGHGAAGGRRRRRARRWRGAGGCRRRPCAVRRGGRGMSPQIELNLGLILFLPWFLILGVLFWLFPRQPRHWRRRLFDLASLVLAVAAFMVSLYWAQDHADPAHGQMWRQVLATSIGYGVFLGALTLAVLVRWWTWRRGPARVSSEERRVGKECVRPCRFRWSPYP